MPPRVKNQVLKNALLKLKKKFPKLRYLWAISTFFTGKSVLHQLGWFKSAWRLSSIDAKGNPIPWLTYPAVDFLQKRTQLIKKSVVWEYGSGNSTIWWAKHAEKVYSVEYDRGWYEFLKTKLSHHRNAELIFQELGDGYPKAIKGPGRNFDIVVIDGRMRVECAILAGQSLKKRGVIIWDNTDRQRYNKGIQHLHDLGFKSIDFIGPTPIDNILNQTTIFYKSDNLFDI